MEWKLSQASETSAKQERADMNQKDDTRRRMTDQELAEVRQMLQSRKSELWQEISEDIEADARDEYQDLIRSIRDESDRALAELEETALFSYVKVKVEESKTSLRP